MLRVFESLDPYRRTDSGFKDRCLPVASSRARSALRLKAQTVTDQRSERQHMRASNAGKSLAGIPIGEKTAAFGSGRRVHLRTRWGAGSESWQGQFRR